MKKILFILLTFHLSIVTNIQAQNVLMRDVFAETPDTIFPLLTKYNKLDCIDFIENNMKATVKNKFDDEVELEALTKDYLRFRNSKSSVVEMKLLCLDTISIIDSTRNYMVCVCRTYMGPTQDSNVEMYCADWKLIKRIPRPEIADFFKDGTDTQSDSIISVRNELEVLPLIKASLSPDDTNITWNIETGELSKETKKIAKEVLQTIITPIQ